MKLKINKPVNHYPNRVCESPIVSICVQTYQHVSFIRECLDGILMQQTNFAIEILLGEDASTDGTREVCIEYAGKYPDKIRLFLHHRENNIAVDGNPTGRFNLLYNLEQARGQFVALCEGDDYWIDPFKLQKQVDLLRENSDYSYCFTDSYVKTADELSAYSFMKKSRYSTEDLIVNSWFSMTATIVFVRAQLILPPWMMKIKNADFCIQLCLSTKGDIGYIDKRTSVHRKHSGGISNTFTQLNLLKHLSLLFLYYNRDTEGRFSTDINFRIKSLYDPILRRKKHLKFFEYLKFYLNALRYTAAYSEESLKQKILRFLPYSIEKRIN